MALERSALCKLAQKNLERKKMELLEKELKRRRQTETSLQLPPQTVDTGNAEEASFSLLPVNGTTSSVQRKHPGSALKKKVLRKQDNVPLLPNMPIIHGNGIFPCKFSVTWQTATGAKRREEPLCGNRQKDTASCDPQQALLKALSLLGSNDWELKEKALSSIQQLAGSHSEVVLCRLCEICLAVTSEVSNLRSKVSYAAIITLGELFATLKKDMDSEVDEVAQVLLLMVWNSPEFVEKAANQTLGIMVENVTPAQALAALMDRGAKSRYVQVRKCAAKLLLSLMGTIGVTKLADTPRAESLAQVAGKLAQDGHKDTRHYGQEMVKMLLSHQKFKRLLEQSVSTCDLEDILTRIKKKEMENQKSEGPSVKMLVKKSSDSSKKPQATLPSVNDMPLFICSDASELLLQIVMPGVETLLQSDEFPYYKTHRSHMRRHLNLEIFDYFVLRISDSHKKVKQKVLDVLSEIIGILCLEPVLVEWVYPRSPEVVQRSALPVLWSFLGNKALPVRRANVRTVVTKLASALHEVMGTKLRKCAASQPPHVWENLSSILGW
ncbi:TOG array regulator of axonemal microtubules protein 2-like [Poecile atricapillus]|uniref:TOG array regulator of axonemal microtubules protein 2-like n=1 Tax=Poecile atricapillus TaxID=48891 RepID=UPI0027397229|nr:TOG array regulator of axonemal microtubules protein 2-like [Poecile atricapillus]